MRNFVTLAHGLSRICGLVSMALIAAASLVVCQMVFMRYVLNASTVWQTEFVIYAVIASTFIGAPYVLLHKGHVAVDLLPMMLAPKPRLVMQSIANLLSLMFCALLAYSAWHYFHEAFAKGWKTDTVWAIPLWIPLLPLPLGIGALCLQYIADIYESWNHLDVNKRSQA